MKRNEIFKCLTGFLLGLILSAFDLISVPDSINVLDAFAFKVFGRISFQDESVYVVAMQNLLFVVVCNILFADFISSHFRTSCVYVFSRIHNRTKWFRKQVRALLTRTAMFTGCYLVSIFFVCVRKSSIPVQVTELYPLFVIVLFSIFLCFTTTLLINLLSIRWGTTVGFLSSQILLFTLVFMSTATSHIQVLTVLNPVSCLNILERPESAAITLLIDLVWFGILFGWGAVYVKKYDVFLFDAEVG